MQLLHGNGFYTSLIIDASISIWDSVRCGSSEGMEKKMSPVPKPLQDRLLSKVTSINLDDCWEWTAAKDKDGYGTIQARKNGKWGKYRAHRISYEIFEGEIPEGFLICHSCDNPSCINPDHLFLGTQLDNCKDAQLKGRYHHTKKTHCWKGHEYTKDNTYHPPSRYERVCKTCHRERKLKYQQQKGIPQ